MKTKDIEHSFSFAVDTLKTLIGIQSFSKEESGTADVIATALSENGYKVNRKGNNIWARSKDFDPDRKTILLNSHVDTVKPAKGWTYDPFTPTLEGDKLTGLGSNDAGAPLVSLLSVFFLSEDMNLNYNRVFLATAEEEITGAGGAVSVLSELGDIYAGIVGEPTQMEMAVAEKGLMVLDCEVRGKSGHAARTGGVNAITEAIKEIEWFHSFKFPKTSSLLGDVKMTVTIIHAGTQHNVIPDTCSFVVDVRTNENYSNAEALEIIKNNTNAEVTARSLRMNSSGISKEHPIVKSAKSIGIKLFGSPTTSDQSVMTMFPTVKIGPGDSNRSHTANEYIYLSEIKNGIQLYAELLKNIVL